jgi:NAD(P)-dependent dehydrogenase (short-subunit alcohol dehydrogenase family)
LSAKRLRSARAPKFIMVTGASSGLGRATAAGLADAGHVVFAAARREGELEDLAQGHPNARPTVLDVTDPASIDRTIDRVRSATAGRGLDVLVNAAGRLVLGPVEAVPDEQVRAQFDVNLFGLLAVTRAVLPLMHERGAGRIVNISSILGKCAFPGSGVYSATKFAIEACSDALRMELAPLGISVVLVEPGVIDTPLYETGAASLSLDERAAATYRATWPAGFGFPERLLKMAIPVDDIAAKVIEAALAPKPRSRYRPGLRNRANIRLLTGLPTLAADRIKRRLAGQASAPR